MTEQKIEAFRAVWEVTGRVVGLYHKVYGLSPTFYRIMKVRSQIESQWIYVWTKAKKEVEGKK